MPLLLIINRYKHLILAVLLFVAGWTVNGWRWEAKYANQLEAARETEQSLQAAVDAITNESAAKMRRIVGERDAAIKRLRNRPERMPESARADCKGATGAELSRQDAGFLVRFASDAETVRTALGICYDYADKIKAGTD